MIRDLAPFALGILLGGLSGPIWRRFGRGLLDRLRDRSDPDVWRCRRCRRSAHRVTPHPARYAVGSRGGARAIFAICDDCHEELATPEARYPFYAETLIELRETLAAERAEESLARLNAEMPAIVAAIRVGA